MFDVFVAALRCPACGAVTANAEIQTHIRGGCADSSSLVSGFELSAIDVTAEHLVGSGYEIVTPPGADGPIRLLDIWICPRCETEQWATVEIAGCKIRSIEAVQLNRASLESAHFINELEARLRAEALDNKPADGASSVEVLRRLL